MKIFTGLDHILSVFQDPVEQRHKQTGLTSQLALL